MNEENQAGRNVGYLPMKTFEEMSLEEKIEFLYKELKMYKRADHMTQRRLHALESHGHEHNGAVMIPVHYARDSGLLDY